MWLLLYKNWSFKCYTLNSAVSFHRRLETKTVEIPHWNWNFWLHHLRCTILNRQHRILKNPAAATHWVWELLSTPSSLHHTKLAAWNLWKSCCSRWLDLGTLKCIIFVPLKWTGSIGSFKILLQPLTGSGNLKVRHLRCTITKQAAWKSCCRHSLGPRISECNIFVV